MKRWFFDHALPFLLGSLFALFTLIIVPTIVYLLASLFV